MHTHNAVLFSHTEWNYVICRKTDGTRDSVKWNNPDWGRQILHVLARMKNLDQKIPVTRVQNMRTVWGWEPAGGKGWKEKMKGVRMWSKTFINMYENRTKEFIKFF
jgi:hypothetical protein